MKYSDIGHRHEFLDWIWILRPTGLERRRAQRFTHEIAWPGMDKLFPNGRLEQDNKIYSVVIPEESELHLDDVVFAIEEEFGPGFQYILFESKE